ncbi:hypothetical protein [Clostridium arbusti]|jgi:hypothetical protein|uniref:hypothetical protein n=1 Tax=Clostridium arbusti TaxID=1137848 RepID=UPI00030FBF47|nr:hypothetical protein [Clostridium arbusti]
MIKQIIKFCFNIELNLGNECFDKVVGNIDIFDINDVNPLLNAAYGLLKVKI